MALRTLPVMNICHYYDEKMVFNGITTKTVSDTESAPLDGRRMLSRASTLGAVERPSAATIFVVEDDVDMSDTLSKALRASGYRVFVASNGGEALALFSKVQPDLIILDLMLPDTDGLFLTTSLRTLTSAPIVICSARQGQIDRVVGARLGATDFVGKPFELDDLEARVEGSLRRARQQDEPTLSDEIQVRRHGHRAKAGLCMPLSGEQNEAASQCRETGNGMGRK